MRGPALCESTTAIILAGGFGTRLRSAIGQTPKPLAPISGQPFLVHVLSYLARQGFRDVILSVGYKQEEIERVIGENSQGMTIRYSKEETPLGTGGALRRALSLVSSDYALVLNGDTFLKVDYEDMIRCVRLWGCTVCIALKYVDDCSRFGAIKEQNGIVTGFVEKGATGSDPINAGVYVVQRNLFDDYELPRSFSFEHEFLTKYLPRLRPRAYYTDGYFIDIGVPSDYLRARVEIPRELSSK